MQMQYSDKIESNSKQMLVEMQAVNDSLRKDTFQMSAEIKLLTEQVVSITNTLKNVQETVDKFQMETMQMTSTDLNMQSSDDALNKDISVNLAETDRKIVELNLKQQLQENSTYNGKMIWKIDNLKLRMQQAITGHVTALHSAPCFTEKYGYKYLRSALSKMETVWENARTCHFFS